VGAANRMGTRPKRRKTIGGGTRRWTGSSTAAITAAISSAGFRIDRLVEPAPLPSLQQHDPTAYDKLRTRPGFLFFRLVKRSAGRT
jgi:hypothetical protein